MWIPPGIQPQGNEITRDLFAAPQDNFDLVKRCARPVPLTDGGTPIAKLFA